MEEKVENKKKLLTDSEMILLFCLFRKKKGTKLKMSKPNPEDYEYVEVEVDEEEEEENQEEVEVEVDTAQAKRIGTHHKKEKEIKSFADLAVFNRNTQKLEEEVQARGAVVSLTLVFPDKKSHVIKVTVPFLITLFCSF